MQRLSTKYVQYQARVCWY